MSTDRTAQIVELVEQYTEIAINPDPSSWGTFERVLVDIGAAALDYEAEHDIESHELVTTFQVVAASFERVQAQECAETDLPHS